ncbi:MAG TPA: histidine kinase N-terminal 7TM domain-containing protein [Anaerolineales bacterium]|nr:histidine kinase N-terminal 7TM domain-containing protein [Anaerolineales bacterium]
MPWQINLPALVLFLTAGAVASAVWITSQRRSALGGKVLLGLMISILIWAVCAAIEAAYVDLPHKITSSKFEYIGAATAAPLLLIFTLVFTHRIRLLTTPNLIAFWTIPVATIFLAFTNEYHHLIWTNFESSPEIGSNLIIYEHGIAFWIYLAYAYLCVGAATVLLIIEYRRAKSNYRKQVGAILISTLFPWLGNLLYNFGPNPIPGLDLAVVGFACTGLTLTWAFLSTGLLDLIPIAHSTLIEHLQDGVIVIDSNNRIVEANTAAAYLLNQSTLPIGADVFKTFQAWPTLASTLVQKIGQPTEIPLPGSPQRYLDVRVTPVFDPNQHVAGHLAVLREITDRKRIETALRQKSLELEQRVMTDELTGLYNRRNLDKFLEQEFRRAERYRIPAAFALFDVDDFKKINDTYGHLCGDVVLRSVAEALRHEIRITDVAARIGGDEFFVIFPHTSEDQAWGVMERLRQHLSIFKQKCGDFYISISVGVTGWIPGDSPEEVVRRVDRLLYQAKEQGKNRVIRTK